MNATKEILKKGTWLVRTAWGMKMLAYYNGEKWLKLWGNKLDEIEVTAFMPVPLDSSFTECRLLAKQ